MKEKVMKSTVFAFAAAILATTSAAWSVSPTTATLKPITYAHLRAEVRRISGIDGGDSALSSAIARQPIRLHLKPFGGVSKAFYVSKTDMIGFICDRAEPGFKGGPVDAFVLRHEAGADDGDFFVLDNCTGVK